MMAEVRSDPRVVISEGCRAAVERLRREYGMVEASPFSYLEGVSPYLNLYPEPPRFLDEDARRAFEPMVFFGCLAPEVREAISHARPLRPYQGKTRVYVAFGSVIWMYYAAVARSALATLAEVLAAEGAEVLVSLGNHPIDDADRRRIEGPHVRVEAYVDQWGALKDADLFATHRGLNSSHEAAFHQVPMLSYPFFGDQPPLARRCQEMGLAVPLADAPRAPLEARAVRGAVEEVLANREAFRARLAEARRWELEVIAGREAILDRVLALVP